MNETNATQLTYTTEMLVDRYIELRDLIAEKAAQFKAEKESLEESLKALNDEMFVRLKASGGTSLKFAGVGSIISKTAGTFKAADMGEFLRYVAESGKVELLQARISTSAITEWSGDNNNTLPPGIIAETTHSIVVRRA